MSSPSRTPLPLVLLWLVCLAILSVGARNFEMGLSTDGPLYANIARRIAETGEWFRLYGGLPDFDPFVEHPHLGFWILALVFKVLPAADWSARLPGHLFYVGFLFLLFRLIRKHSSERAAVLAVLLLWVWPIFSNWFSNAYLDPGALFFGFLALTYFGKALEKQAWIWSAGAGLALGACALYKGMAVLGFGPAMAYLASRHASIRDPINPLRRPRQASTQAALVLGFFLSVLLVYAWVLSRSQVPNFLELYFARQFGARFASEFSLGNLLNSPFWWSLLRNTHFLLPLVLWPFFRRVTGPRLHLPLILLLTHVLMLGAAGLSGQQYMLYLLPWVAWLIAEGAAETLEFPHEFLMWATQRFAVVAVLLIQYLPIRTHKSTPPLIYEEARKLHEDEGFQHLMLDRKINPSKEKDYVAFVPYAAYPWYTHLDLIYSDPNVVAVPPNDRTLYLLRNSRSRQAKALMLEASGWAPAHVWNNATLYRPKPTP